MESVWRNRWIGADVNTPWQNIPFPFSATSRTPEFRFSARQSRLALGVAGDIDDATHIKGYVETDFLGAAQTANHNESNSYNLRLRQLFTKIDWDAYGAHFLAGQAWSLVTLNTKGMTPETVALPPTIDSQYIPGFVWARQPLMRFVADFDKKLWLGFSAEGSATTFANWGVLSPGVPGTTALPLITTPLLLGEAANGGLYNVLNAYSFNRFPDLITKVAGDIDLGDRTVHVEGFGMLREFADRAYWGNHRVWGGGAGGGVVVPIVPKLIDFQFSGMIGRGVGRYGAGQIADATWSVTGAPLPISERMLLAGVTAHLTPRTDVYVFAGGEFAGKQPQIAKYGNTLVIGGYGNPFYNNLGCNLENEALSTLPFLPVGTAANAPVGGLFGCSGQTKDIRQITGGVWHTFYEGDFGRVKAGVQYSYTIRDAFPGIGGAPRGTENTFYTSFRYYPFEGTAAPSAPLAARF